MRRSLLRAILAGCFLAAAVESGAACTNTGSFERWLSEFKAEAHAKGISPRAIAALDGVTLDQGIIRRDHGQSVFSQSFLEFSDRMANKNRIATGRSRIAKDKALFDKIERQFGVPASAIVAFWGSKPISATIAVTCQRLLLL